MKNDSRIFIAGHKGLVGSALVRVLKANGYTNLILRGRSELDLSRQLEVESFFAKEKPEFVFLAAAKVGGIVANNTYPADFILENLQIQNNVIYSALKHNSQKLLFLGSSCIYPKMAPQPISESALLTGPLEVTNESYAIAKIAGLMTCKAISQQHSKNFISVMPTNVYGPGDRYDAENSHVLPAMILKFHRAKMSQAPSVTLWGTGSPQREFIYSDDLAEACLKCMLEYNTQDTINIGTGQEHTIKDLAQIVSQSIGYTGQIIWDTERPDGTPRKLLDSKKIYSLGWTPKVTLETGIRLAYEDYVANYP